MIIGKTSVLGSRVRIKTKCVMSSTTDSKYSEMFVGEKKIRYVRNKLAGSNKNANNFTQINYLQPLPLSYGAPKGILK